MPLCRCRCQCKCECECECRVFAFLNVLENDLLKISLARHRGKTTSKLIKNLLPSLKNVTPVAWRSIRATSTPSIATFCGPRGRRTFRQDESQEENDDDHDDDDDEGNCVGGTDIERYFGWFVWVGNLIYNCKCIFQQKSWGNNPPPLSLSPSCPIDAAKQDFKLYIYEQDKIVTFNMFRSLWIVIRDI